MSMLPSQVLLTVFHFQVQEALEVLGDPVKRTVRQSLIVVCFLTVH